MKGHYRLIITLILLIFILPFLALISMSRWLPGLVNLWLPASSQLVIPDAVHIDRHGVLFPSIEYQVGSCRFIHLQQLRLSHPAHWRLAAEQLTVDPACAAGLPPADTPSAARKTLAQWQSLLPRGEIRIQHVTLAPWQRYGGSLTLSVSPTRQQLNWQGDHLRIGAKLAGQLLTLDTFSIDLPESTEPVTLAGEVTLALTPEGIPPRGNLSAQFWWPLQAALASSTLRWQENQGELLIRMPNQTQPAFQLPWRIDPQRITVSGATWQWPWEGTMVSGNLAFEIDNWLNGPDNATVTGRINAVTEGKAGKANTVLTLGPGKLSLTETDMPVQMTGDIKQGDLTVYAMLPARVFGPLQDPSLAFLPGALLRTQGRLVNALNIDQVRLPLAGVHINQKGINGRLQAIMQAHEHRLGEFELHLDGGAKDFLPDQGSWYWRYWGKGVFSPMDARWDVRGTGLWQDQKITLNRLSTGFDKLQYGTMNVATPRLELIEPVQWIRRADHPQFSGKLALNSGKTTFSGGSVLAPATLSFSMTGQDPGNVNLRGELIAGPLGPVSLYGRWDGERLRGQAWWPSQALSHFQSLIPPDWKLNLRDGALYGQVAFSAAFGQGFEAGGHGVLRHGSARTPDNQIEGVDFALPFRYRNGTWQLGTQKPVRLRIDAINTQVTATALRADLQGWYPWSEARPLLLSDVSVNMLGGTIEMKQLRMPQHDPALLRLENLSTSELISAVHPKQFAVSGRINGALPLWLNHPQWIVKDGWLSNPGPLTLRLDKDMADAIVSDNVTARSAINWLRYMEISRAWSNIDVDNLGELTLHTTVKGTSYAEGKAARVNLNYRHQENIFMLWRSLRFGDNLQSWLEQNAALPVNTCAHGKPCKKENQ